MALVFLGRRSNGKYFLFLYASLKACFCFWEITVSTCAIDNRTTFLQTNTKHVIIFQQLSNTKPQREIEKDNNLHLGELIGGSTSHFGNAEKRELSFEFLELIQQLLPWLLSKFVWLDPCYFEHTKTKNYHKHTLKASYRSKPKLFSIKTYPWRFLLCFVRWQTGIIVQQKP